GGASLLALAACSGAVAGPSDAGSPDAAFDVPGSDGAFDAIVVDDGASSTDATAAEGATDAPPPTDAPPTADAGAPPAECVPACLWNLFKDCRVIAPCFDDPADGGTLSCRPSTGVTWFTTGTGRTVYRADGAVCY